MYHRPLLFKYTWLCSTAGQWPGSLADFSSSLYAATHRRILDKMTNQAGPQFPPFVKWRHLGFIVYLSELVFICVV